jgi:hypothetical protein
MNEINLCIRHGMNGRDGEDVCLLMFVAIEVSGTVTELFLDQFILMATLVVRQDFDIEILGQEPIQGLLKAMPFAKLLVRALPGADEDFIDMQLTEECLRLK